MSNFVLKEISGAAIVDVFKRQKISKMPTYLIFTLQIFTANLQWEMEHNQKLVEAGYSQFKVNGIAHDSRFM